MITETRVTPAQATQGRLLLLATAVLWSLSGVVAKSLAPLSGAEIAFYRSLFAGLALLPFVPRSRWIFRPVMVPMTLIFGVMVGLYLSSMARTTAANSILLQYSATFWTVPLAMFFLKEKPDRRDRLPIALATVGIAIIVVLGRNGTRGEGLGIGFGLASGFGYAAVIVCMRGLRDLDSAWVSAVNNLGGAITLGVLTWALVGPIQVPSRGQIGVLIVFGIVQMAIPYALFARGLKTVGPAEASLITLIEPLLATLWVFLVHKERPAPATLVGGVFLLAGVLARYLPKGSVAATDDLPQRVEDEARE